ncbi:MAG: T9SS type A sorting domain-containing protein [Ferruginibacter sp.]|nr:T9SS type A sorting domain-containing protein [Ferruginibacter sp.]
MKKVILLLITIAGMLSISNAQRVRGTLRNATGLPNSNEVIVSIKPTAAFNALISNLIVSVQIPTSVGARPVVNFTNLQPSLFATWTQLDADQGDGFYTWGFNCVAPGASNTDATAWSTAELDVLKISFVGNTATPFTARLCHYLDGGTGSFALFYVETNLAAVNGGVLSDWGSLFYGTGATNGIQAAGSIGVPNAQYSFAPVPNIVLPVKFLGFTATRRDNSAILNWQIENESDITDRYEIERTLNGADFRKVYTVPAKNNGNSSNAYVLTDLNLSAIRSSGIFYYRIKQVDKDGRFVYSEIRSVRLNSRGIAIGVFPNPIREFANLTIDLEQDASATISINDASGKQMKNIQMQLFKGANIKKINMASLAAGSYMLKIQTSEEIKTIQVVKTN